MAGMDGGAQANGVVAAQTGSDSLAAATRALLVAVGAGFAARVPEAQFEEAKAELDAIRAALEGATNKIIDAGAKVDAIAESVDEENRDRLGTATAAIYESMEFQDLTGQRLTKIERSLTGIQALLAGGESTPNEAVSEDDKLLHGPQLPENAMDQDEIDALLAGDG